MQMDVLLIGKEVTDLDLRVGLLYTFLKLSVSGLADALTAGRLSGQKVELGLIPLGAPRHGLQCAAVCSASSYA